MVSTVSAVSIMNWIRNSKVRTSARRRIMVVEKASPHRGPRVLIRWKALGASPSRASPAPPGSP